MSVSQLYFIRPVIPMKFLTLLSFLATLAVSFIPARAEGDPVPAPGGPAATVPNTPAPPADPAAGAGAKPVARKEDEETATAGMLARIRAWGTGKSALADDIAGLQQKLSAAEATIKTRDKRITDLEAENATMRTDLTAFGNWLETRGATDLETTSPAGTAAAQAVGAGVANVIRQIGVPAATIKITPAAGAAVDKEALTAAIEAMQAERDPVKKGKLCDKIDTLRAQLKKQSSN